MSLSQRYRQFELVVPTACPACGDVAGEDVFSGGETVCGACSHAWQPSLEACDRQGEESLRFRYLSQDELCRRLADIADQRNGQVGQRYLADNDPELLFNCVAHHGSYKRARRALRRWMVVRDEAAKPTVVVQEVRQGSKGVNCPYCRDVFEEDEQPYRCACGATLHPDCRVELGRCTTLGCAAAYTPPPPRVVVRERAAEQEAEDSLDSVWRRLINRERLKFSLSNPWPLRLIGLPFFGMGLVALAVVGELAMKQEWAGALLALVMFLVFGGVGGVMSFGCVGSTIDRERGTVRSWKGLRIPFLYSIPVWSKEGTKRLERYSRVRLREEDWWKGDKGQGWSVYAVKLGDLDLYGSRTYMGGRRCAEQVAKFLDIGFQDEVGGRHHFRPPGALDRPWLEGSGSEEFTRVRPKDCAVERRVENGEAIYTLPSRRRLGVPLTLALVMTINFFFFSDWPRWACLAAFAIPFLISLVYAMRTDAADTVRASPDGVQVVRRWWLGSWTYDFPAAELEEVHLNRRVHKTIVTRFDNEKPRVLTLISDDRAVEIGVGLKKSELRWLRASIADDMRGVVPPAPEKTS